MDLQDLLVPYDETAESLFKRGRVKPIKTGLPLFDTDLPAPLNYGDVVEIFGQSNIGKTEMLYHIIVTSILPNTWKGVPLGGNNSAVVHFDNDYHFCMTRLLTIMESRIKVAFSSSSSSSSSTPSSSSSTQKGQSHKPSSSQHLSSPPPHEPLSPQDLQDIVISSLRSLHVINCKDNLQFLATLQTLPVLLDSEPNIRLLTIDSISSFYWLNKYEERDTSFQRQVTATLKKLLNKHMLLLFATKGTKTIPKEGDKDQDGLLQHVEYLDSWDIVKHRVILCRPPASNTPPSKMDKEKKGLPSPFIAKVISPFSGPPPTNTSTTSIFVPHQHASGTTSVYKYVIDGNGITFWQ